jgi:hypothetical protein
LIPADLVPRQQGGAFHLNIRELSSVLDLRRIDIDVLFVNQPELVPALRDFFNKWHFFDAPSFSYIHWLDWKRDGRLRNDRNAAGNLSLLSGVLLSSLAGCNSRFGRTKILREAGRWFNDKTVESLERKLRPLWPGINTGEILAARTRERFPHKTIIFPFRAQGYTGFKSLIEMHLAKLWMRRKDFRLLLTNPSDYDYAKRHLRSYPFVRIARFARDEYLRALWMADIVVGCHLGINQWSLAMVEAVAAECIPLLNQESFFPEMILEALPAGEHLRVKQRYFYFRGTFNEKLDVLLDHVDEERERMKFFGRAIRGFYDWDVRAGDWIRCLEDTDALAPQLTERSASLRKIEALLAGRGACTKNEILLHMGWHPKSAQISWTKYRKALKRRWIEDPGSPLVTFRRKPPAGRKRTDMILSRVR